MIRATGKIRKPHKNSPKDDSGTMEQWNDGIM
jgi:hypothetical protein